MFGTHVPSALILALAVALAGSARAGSDAIYDALSPVANATIVSGSVAGVIGDPGGHDANRGADGLFYVQVLVNDRPVRFLVDSGASVVVLTAADARAVGITIGDQHYDRQVETVGGRTPMAWATLKKVDIAGHQVRDVRAAVVREGLGVSLLGQNMLSRLNSVTMTADRISLR